MKKKGSPEPSFELYNEVTQQGINILLEIMGGRIHAESSIKIAGTLSGVTLLRDLFVGIERFPVGTRLTIPGMEDVISRMLEGKLKFCLKQLSINPDSGWNDPIPEEHNQSPFSTLEITDKFEMLFDTTYSKLGIEADWRAVTYGILGIQMIKQSEKILSPDIGKAILLNSMIEGSQSVPNDKSYVT